MASEWQIKGNPWPKTHEETGQTHGKRRADTWKAHGQSLANHGKHKNMKTQSKHKANTGRRNGTCMAKHRQTIAKTQKRIANAWQAQGREMANAWQTNN